MTAVRPSRRVTAVIDVALAAWIVACVVLGVVLARETRGLGTLSTTVVLAGQALHQTADVLRRVGRIPIVGEDVGDLADRVERTGRSAVRNARAGRGTVDRVSTLLGISVALIPTLPVAALYLPLRLAWRRDTRAVRRALGRGGHEVDAYLALRAVQSLRADRLLEVSADPWGDLAAGRHTALADAELRRVGIRREGR